MFGTLIAPTIIIIEIKIVIHKLKAKITLTVAGESQFNRIVLYCNRTVNNMINVTIADNIVATPVIMEPVRSG